MGIGPKYWDQKCIFAIKKHNDDVEVSFKGTLK